jgi:hypothetical protein
MKKVVRNIIIGIIAIVAFLAAIIQPWKYVASVPVIGQNAALTVKTIAGKGVVYLDGKEQGGTPLSSENLSPGDYELKIERISETEGFYEDLVTQIHLEQNTRTFVEAEIGPGENFSSLTVLYYQKNKNDKAELYLETDPSNSSIWIDDIDYGTSPLTTGKLKEGKHELKISHPGYEDINTNLIIRKGYTLIADIQLMARPAEIETQ